MVHAATAEYDAALYTVLTVISAVSFVGFGLGYLTVPQMRAEFARYGMANLRVLAACLQIAGGLGQGVGLWVPKLNTAASAGLAAMMLVAVGVRIHVGDPALRTIPAVAYLLLCVYLTWASIRR